MKLVKKVVEIGNGAAVYVPREYKGKEVIVVIPEGIENLKRNLLNKLIEFIPNVLGVYLYGSYARNEQTKDSDIDILIIVKEKNEKIKDLFEDIDVRIITLDSIKNSIKNLPAITMPILKEAKVILNPLLLEELRNSEVDFKKFKWNFDDIKRIIKIIRGFIKIDDKDISSSHIYSLIMRIRVCYMIETLLKNKIFSNKGVRDLLLNYGLGKEKIDKFYSIYRAIREDREAKIKVNKREILELISILEKYSKNIKNETEKKIKKRD